MGAAWTAPVVVIATSVPAAAASILVPGSGINVDYSNAQSFTNGQLQVDVDVTFDPPDEWPDDLVLAVVCTITIVGPAPSTASQSVYPSGTFSEANHIGQFEHVFAGLATGSYDVTWSISGQGTSSSTGDTYIISPPRGGNFSDVSVA
ncbi:hypothetical protein [Demequina sp. NBRC 110056]|uniref:hypothetical protein n=1 Tax=Demequina sp. NBRC 110056 TaxID=1570345 RepID=UPI00135670DF|nr:hypothetical protein [Demequina sp. NBRC 110056]